MTRPRFSLFALGLGFALVSAACSPHEGASCGREGEGRCESHDTALTCRGGTWRRMACRGAGACSTRGGSLRCDQDVAQEGEVCTQFSQHACPVDPRPGTAHVLVCSSATGTWVREIACFGPGGCHAQGSSIDCDDSLSQDGELCSHDGQVACTAPRGDGGAALLRCQNGRFGVERQCATCAVGAAGLQCE